NASRSPAAILAIRSSSSPEAGSGISDASFDARASYSVVGGKSSVLPTVSQFAAGRARIALGTLTPHLRVGACQTPEILCDSEAALSCMEAFARQPGSGGVDLLLFPECFLQGYLVESEHLSR